MARTHARPVHTAVQTLLAISALCAPEPLSTSGTGGGPTAIDSTLVPPHHTIAACGVTGGEEGGGGRHYTALCLLE